MFLLRSIGGVTPVPPNEQIDTFSSRRSQIKADHWGTAKAGFANDCEVGDLSLFQAFPRNSPLSAHQTSVTMELSLALWLDFKSMPQREAMVSDATESQGALSSCVCKLCRALSPPGGGAQATCLIIYLPICTSGLGSTVTHFKRGVSDGLTSKTGRGGLNLRITFKVTLRQGTSLPPFPTLATLTLSCLFFFLL